ncbi:MAG: endolytic transglycosylase MltG [Acidimicrobiales bacterium]
MSDDRDPFDRQDAEPARARQPAPGPRYRRPDPDPEEVDYDDHDDRYDDDDGDGDGDGDYVEMRRESSRGRRVLAVVLVVLVVLAVAAAGTVVWVQRQLDPPGAAGEPQPIVVPEGSTSDDIGRLLAAENIIPSDVVWGWYLRINGGGPFQAGNYQLSTNSSIREVIDALEAGPAPIEERSFTIPEGLLVTEILDRLADPDTGLGFDRAALQQLLDSGQIRWQGQPADQPSNEGILFPETYRVDAEADEQAVLRLLVAQLDGVMTELGVASAQDRLNLTPYEVLVVASLIEEETKVDGERSMVARVIYNRLSEGIPLGIDATSRYEAILAGRDRGQLDFESDSPYNTRRIAGLPPTPIAAPGRASIEAALNPADGPWIYYVLEDAEGNHFFTESDREFLAAKERCRQNDLGCG